MANSSLNDQDKEYIASKVVEYLLAQASGLVDKDDEKDEGKEGEKKDDKDSMSIKDLVKKVVAILAPAALIASVIGSEAGGIRVFLSSIKVLGNMLGAVLTPGLIFASAMVLTLSDMIGEWLIPNLEKWYTFVITSGYDWLVKLDKGVTEFVNMMIDGVNDLVKTLSNTNKVVGLTALAMGVFMKQLGMGGDSYIEFGKEQYKQGLKLEKMPEVQQIQKDGITKMWKSIFGEGTRVDENGRPVLFEGGSFSQRMPENLRKAALEFRLGNTPQSQQMGIADAARNAQMAGFNMTPFESKNLALLDMIANLLDTAIAKLPGPATTE